MLLFYGILIFYLDHFIAYLLGKTEVFYLNSGLIGKWFNGSSFVLLALFVLFGLSCSYLPSFNNSVKWLKKRLVNTEWLALIKNRVRLAEVAQQTLKIDNKLPKYQLLHKICFLLCRRLTPYILALLGAFNHLLHHILCSGVHDYFQIMDLHFDISDILVILGLIFMLFGRVHSFQRT